MKILKKWFQTQNGAATKWALALAIAGFALGCDRGAPTSISLEGPWTVRLDSLDVGESEAWASAPFDGAAISLPGTLDDAGMGTPNTLEPELNNYVLSNLARKHQYIGKAWYQREVYIPKDWENKKITLTLERVIWESTVFVNGREMGKAESLIGSHTYDLTEAMTPGKHLLTIRIDNGNKYPLINVPGTRYPDPINQDMAHGYTNHTQIKWNGMLGDLILEAASPNAPGNLQIYPKVDTNSILVTYEQPNEDTSGQYLEILNANGTVVYHTPMDRATYESGLVSLEVQRPEALYFWDEFNPKVYTARVVSASDTLQAPFGYQKIAQENGDLTLNGKRIYLRGNLECSIFPLTGHPPMEKEGWASLIGQAKAYGLNHLRFHSWCPPRAAFEAADEAGFYLQVELAHWSLRVGEDAATTAFLRKEADKLLREYGNHPSFILFALGNELQGDIGLLNEMTAELKKKDQRHLYATTAFSFQRPTGERPEPEDEYFITQWTDKGWIRGQGIFNSSPPHFNADYSANSEHIEIPLISHEIGQYAVYPDMSEIPKYTGVLEPLNFMAIRNDLEQKGLLGLAGDFTNASGKLAALLYKEEIERALKTPGFDGFQLLQLQDFPGQGTALVGLLNAFWESKGAISAQDFRKFNSEVVPLVRFEKAVYESGETFKALVEVANFFKELSGQRINWSLSDEDGTILEQGSFGNVDLILGNNVGLGAIELALETERAQKLTLAVAIEGTEYQNDWSIWAYPKNVPTTANDIVVTSSMARAVAALENGRKVLLSPDPESLEGVQGRFVPVFWSPVHFPNQPATMGFLVNKEHPALTNFPTDTHTDWQWWDLAIRSKSVSMDSLDVEPIVRSIDNFVTNRSLTTLFQAKAAKGALVFSAMDVTSDLENRPVARQLRHSLLTYMKSDAFAPNKSVTVKELRSLGVKNGEKGFSTKDIYQ
ncbi:sugar-binding domain-containing protein [Maribacter sp. 2307ULW6-5]|uniref:sugar-binding domain-containing protein n=1 Tax=Maribacter sp. 2307ULW6-5 TaxID=3386275 RepID=UPI0039BCB608